MNLAQASGAARTSLSLTCLSRLTLWKHSKIQPEHFHLALWTNLLKHCLQDYIAVKEKYARYMPHSAGRLGFNQFSKISDWDAVQIRSKEVPQGAVPHRWEALQLAHDARQEQRWVSKWPSLPVVNPMMLYILSFSWLLMSLSVSDQSFRLCCAQVSVDQIFTNSIFSGKKLMTVRIVKHAFEIIHLLTGENPLQANPMQYLNSLCILTYLIHLGLYWARLGCCERHHQLWSPRGLYPYRKSRNRQASGCWCVSSQEG